MDTIVAVMKGGSKPRRRWSDAEKRRIVAETLEPGASVSVVARRHDVNANQVFGWRRQYQDGLLADGTAVTAMVPVQVATGATIERADVADPVEVSPGLIEIELPAGIKVRVSGAVDGGTLQRVLSVLSRR